MKKMANDSRNFFEKFFREQRMIQQNLPTQNKQQKKMVAAISISAFALLFFLLVSSMFPLKNELFNVLYPKQPSQAAESKGEIIFSSILLSNFTANQATVGWDTSLSSTSRVVYGTAAYRLDQSTNLDPKLVTKHQVILDNLKASTLYYYRIYSKPGRSSIESFSPVQSFKTRKD